MTIEREDAKMHPLCGTNSGYVRHLGLGEDTCGPCRDAHNAYWRAYLAEHPEQVENNKKTVRLYSKARGRALRRLAEAFPELYQEFFAEERAKVAAEERAKSGGEAGGG